MRTGRIPSYKLSRKKIKRLSSGWGHLERSWRVIVGLDLRRITCKLTFE
jgi:hypothetical protein